LYWQDAAPVDNIGKAAELDCEAQQKSGGGTLIVPLSGI
jgi:hypothetical protein